MSRTARATLVVWLGLVVVVIAWDWRAHPDWRGASGLESEQIARNLAVGRGFSFDGPDRWLFFSPLDSGAAFPTAWKEPLYPAFIAAAFRALGEEEGRALVAVTQAVCLALTAVAVAGLGYGLFGLPTGLLAGVVLVMMPSVEANARETLDSSPLAALYACVCALIVLGCARTPTCRRGAVLGAALGVGMLLNAGTLLFPVVALSALLLSGAPLRQVARAAAAMLFTTALVITPWTLRNWSAFHALVPVRTGMGFNLTLGFPFLAETFVPDLDTCPAAGPPPFHTAGARAALVQAQTRESRFLLYERQFECLKRSPPARYAAMNEAERDAAQANLALDFVRTHPRVSARLFTSKLFVLLFDLGGSDTRLVAAVSLLFGTPLAFLRPQAWVVPALAAAFAVPNAFGFPVFYRYRYPMEPLLVLLACHAVVSTVALGRMISSPSTTPRRAN